MLNNSSKKSKQQKSGTLFINYHFVYYNMLQPVLKTWGKLACKSCNLIVKSIQESTRTVVYTKSWLKFLQLHFMWLSYITNLWFDSRKYFACSAVSERNWWKFAYGSFSMKHFDRNGYLSVLFCEQYYTFFYVV